MCFNLICCSPEAARLASETELRLLFGGPARAWNLKSCERIALADGHIDEDAAERYVLSQLPQAETERLEEHMLVCEDCRLLVTETERYVGAMREALERTVKEFRHSLCDLESVFARLVYFSSLRDHDGRYNQSGLSADLDQEKTDRIIRAAHAEAFAEWLTLSLEGQKSDLDLYLSEFEGPRKKAVVHYWARIEPHRGVIPERASDAERVLYLADFEALLALLAAQYENPA